MNAEEAHDLLVLSIALDSLPFIHQQSNGIQPVLMPNEVYRWHGRASAPQIVSTPSAKPSPRGIRGLLLRLLRE